MSSVDQAASSLEDAHLTNAGLAGDGFGADGTSPHVGDNGEFFEQPGGTLQLLCILWPCGWRANACLSGCNAAAMSNTRVVVHPHDKVLAHMNGEEIVLA